MTVESRWLSRSRAASNSSVAAVFCLGTLEKIHKYQKYRLAAPTRKLWDQTTLVMVRRARAVKWCIQLHLIRNRIMLMEVAVSILSILTTAPRPALLRTPVKRTVQPLLATAANPPRKWTTPYCKSEISSSSTSNNTSRKTTSSHPRLSTFTSSSSS